MKVILISNPTSRRQKPDFPPPGIAYLGAVAHQDGHDVRLVDAGLKGIREIVRDVEKFSPELIGVTCWTIDRGEVWRLAEVLRGAMPGVPLVMGGPHATIFPGHIFKKTHAEAVIIGEGEKTFSEYMRAVENKEDVRKIEGLALPDRDGGVFYTQPRGAIEDLDSIPLPYYDGFEGFSFTNYGGFPLLPEPTAAVISSRGCVFDCSYCASVQFWGTRWRFRSPDSVLKEMGWLVKKYGVRSFYFFDDNFPVNRKRAIEICQGIIDSRWDIKWACCSHVRMMNRPLLEVMKASGCVTIDFGVESGSNRILENINKKQTSEDIEKTFRLVHEAGILPRAYLMVGNMGENEETIDETIGLIGRIKPRSSIGANILWLLPGTEVYRRAVENGHISEDYWLEHDEVPYNTQEYSLCDLEKLRNRLMVGISKAKGGIRPWIGYLLKWIYYKYPILSAFRSLIPKSLR